MSTDPPWQIIVPVKCTHLAKTRLQPPPGVSRAALAHAMTRDTLSAAAQTVGPSQVIVVTSDAAVSVDAHAVGIATLPDPGHGLNHAILAGLRWRPAHRQAVLLADLPALRPSELIDALRLCADHPVAVVTDHDGTGTSLLTGCGALLRPYFGPGSAQLHRDRLGAVSVHPQAPGLRRDVDDSEDLRAALELGVGPHTLTALRGPLG
ncbi:MAG: 2-phospho-L-lactate guanylyltransferase [Ornithinimicrobium sp.]